MKHVETVAANGEAGRPRVVLASASPRRRALLERWGVAYESLPAEGVDESDVRGSPDEVAHVLAERKARWAHARLSELGRLRPGVLVLGADTVVGLDGELLGKPRDDEHARHMLARLSGRSHDVITAVAVVDERGSIVVESERAVVAFRDVGGDEIAAYVATGDHRGKAGAYGIQSGGATLVAGFSGCYYTIVGLPVRRALRLLGRGDASCDCGDNSNQRGEPGCRGDE